MQHIMKMQARAAAVIIATDTASVSVLHGLACHVADIHAKAARAVNLNKKRLNDAAEEADINAKQLIALAALLEYSTDDAFDAPVFIFQNQTRWLVLPIANFSDVNLSLLYRVFSAGIDAARTSVHGQGLTAFDPSDGNEARQQNVICIIPRDAYGNLAEWVTATDVGLALQAPSEGTKLTFEVLEDANGLRVVYFIGGRPDKVYINLYIYEALVWKGSVRAETPLSAAKRAKAIGRGGTQADANDLVAIATAFSADADVQENVCLAIYYIAHFGGAVAACALFAAGGHCVAITALGAFTTNMKVLHAACGALYWIAAYGGADAKAAIRAVDGVMDKLRQASGALRAAGAPDYTEDVLLGLE